MSKNASINISEVADKIRKGYLNINVQELFLSIMIKGLMHNLRNEIKIRDISVPHMILHTGDDRMWLEARGYDASIEPLNISNENTIYSLIPRCIVNPTSVDLDAGQLTSPYSIGGIQYEDETGLYMLKGEFRRMPLKMTFELKYYVESFTDMLELMQYIISNFSFVRTYDIVYMGQHIKCSYKIPDSFSDEHTMDIDGALSENRDHSLNISIEVETNMPVFNNRTIMPATSIINKAASSVTPTNDLEQIINITTSSRTYENA